MSTRRISPKNGTSFPSIMCCLECQVVSRSRGLTSSSYAFANCSNVMLVDLDSLARKSRSQLSASDFDLKPRLVESTVLPSRLV